MRKISEMPEAVQRTVRQGFRIATALPEANRQKVVSLFLQDLEQNTAGFDSTKVARETDLGTADANRLVTAIAIVFALLSESTSSADEFVALGRDKLFDDADSQTVLSVARAAVDNRKGVQRSFELGALAAETLPALTGFDVSVDLRFRFEKSKIKDAISVAIVHVDTDSRPEIWFQLSRGQVERLVERLTEISEQMRTAEDAFKKINEGGG